MNSEVDPLEAELRSLRPRNPSPELQHRIAAELWSAQPPTARVPRRWTRPLAFVVVVAASILAIALFIGQDDRQAIEDPPRLAESPAAAAFDAALPSVWQFRQSLNQAQADLDALLDQHAAARSSAPAPAISLAQTRGFALSDSNLKNLLGEL